MSVEVVEVIAVARGHCGFKLREEGEKFHVPKARLKEPGAWFVPVDAFKPKVLDPRARPLGAGPAPGSRTDAEDLSAPGMPRPLPEPLA